MKPAKMGTGLWQMGCRLIGAEIPVNFGKSNHKLPVYYVLGLASQASVLEI